MKIKISKTYDEWVAIAECLEEAGRSSRDAALLSHAADIHATVGHSAIAAAIADEAKRVGSE